MGDIIQESGIALGNIDKVLPYRESDIGNNKDIRIIRVKEEKIESESKKKKKNEEEEREREREKEREG